MFGDRSGVRPSWRDLTLTVYSFTYTFFSLVARDDVHSATPLRFRNPSRGTMCVSLTPIPKSHTSSANKEADSAEGLLVL